MEGGRQEKKKKRKNHQKKSNNNKKEGILAGLERNTDTEARKPNTKFRSSRASTTKAEREANGCVGPGVDLEGGSDEEKDAEEEESEEDDEIVKLVQKPSRCTHLHTKLTVNSQTVLSRASLHNLTHLQWVGNIHLYASQDQLVKHACVRALALSGGKTTSPTTP